MTGWDGKCEIHGEYVDDVGDCPACEQGHGSLHRRVWCGKRHVLKTWPELLKTTKKPKIYDYKIDK
jgi:hypothetical protein